MRLALPTLAQTVRYGSPGLRRKQLPPIAGGAGFAPVGSIGAANVTANNTPNTPSFGAGESRAAGDLLFMFVAGFGSTTLPATPAGWTLVRQQAGNAASMSLFVKVAAGGDSAPTISALAGTAWTTQVGEFSGNDTNPPLDQSGQRNSGSGTNLLNTMGGPDQLPGELVLVGLCAHYSASVTGTPISITAQNNGMSVTETDNNATNTTNHYLFGWAITTGNANTDSLTATIATGSLLGSNGVYSSFLLYGTTQMVNIGRAAQRAATW